MAGIFYGWMGVYYGEMAQMVDTWAYHYISLEETKLLKSNPGAFFNIWSTYEDGFSNFLYSHNSWWNDIKATLLTKIMAIFNLASFGNYFINVIFFSFFTLFGPIALFRIMQDIFPGRKFLLLLACFLIPSFLYWTSGLLKEGLIFLGLSLLFYHIYFGIKIKKFSLSRILTIAFCFLFVLILRNFLAVVLLPPLFAWILSTRLKVRPLVVFTAVMVVSIALFFLAVHIDARLDFPKATVVKQQEFLQLSGRSTVAVRELEPHFESFLANLPQALSLSILRPYPSDVAHLLSLTAAVEINLLLLLFLVSVIFRKKDVVTTRHSHAFLVFCIFFSLSVLLMVGYTVNNLGAIVRYRSIVLPLLMIPVLARIDWNRLAALLLGNIKSNQHI